MFQTNFVQKIKTHILCSIPFFSKIVTFMRYVEKYKTAGHVTEGNIIWRMRFSCWVNKATKTHSEYVILTVFPWQPMVARTRIDFPFVPTLSVLFISVTTVGVTPNILNTVLICKSADH